MRRCTARTFAHRHKANGGAATQRNEGTTYGVGETLYTAEGSFGELSAGKSSTSLHSQMRRQVRLQRVIDTYERHGKLNQLLFLPTGPMYNFHRFILEFMNENTDCKGARQCRG